MAKRSTLIILLLSLICLIKAEVKRVDYNETESCAEYRHDRSSKILTIAPNFKTIIPEYVKVIVTPEESFETPLLCFSPSDAECLKEREALVKNTFNKPAYFYLKKDQFYGDKKDLLVHVECKEEKCGYTLRFEGGEVAELELNSAFSYLVTEDNKEMTFIVKGSSSSGSFYTIGFEGSTANLVVDNIQSYIQDLNNGRIVTFPLEEITSGTIAKFQIKNATEGDFISLTCHYVEEGRYGPENFLYPNGPSIMGTLRKSQSYYEEECFPITAFTQGKYKNIKKYYLTGRLLSKYGLIFLYDENDEYIEDSQLEIRDGQYSYMIDTTGAKRTVCIEFSYPREVILDYVVFSLSLVELSNIDNIYNFNYPQYVGSFYRRMIPKGKYAVFHPDKLNKTIERYTYNVYNRDGAVEMFVERCASYPKCEFDINKLTPVKKVAKQSIYELKTKDGFPEAIGKDKNVMIVYCRDEGDNEKGYCEFDSYISAIGEPLELLEGEKTYKYVLEKEEGFIYADLKYGEKIQRAMFDIEVFSGDVTFEYVNKETNDDIDSNLVVYHLSNKVVFLFNNIQNVAGQFYIKYKTFHNSFFSVQYSVHNYNMIQTEEHMISGESYLVQIDPKSKYTSKSLFLHNYRKKEKQTFMANFFAINCEFSLTRKIADKELKIPFSDGYAQETIPEDTEGYKSKFYNYTLTIEDVDPSNYDHKMCMIYVAGYESEDPSYKTEILVSENVNQQIIFSERFKTIRFLYPLADEEKDLSININIIDKAYYQFDIYSNSNQKPIQNFNLTRSKTIYISTGEISGACPKNTLCNIILEAKFLDYLKDEEKKTNPMIEITFRHSKNMPAYLQKSQAKRDYTCGDYYYYLYTDIGKNEAGEVSVNFLRDFGKVWGKIVKKKLNSPEDGADWRGLYKLPNRKEDEVGYDGYTKKFTLDIEKTQDCFEGCYLLLAIQVSEIGETVNLNKFYPFTIISRINPNVHALTDSPKVTIQVEEYIVGNVDVSENERIFQFFELWFPHDSLDVHIDWQSSVAGIFVNVGGQRPTTKNADFKLLPPGKHTVFKLSKYQIIDAAQKKKITPPIEGSIEDLNIVIGVWTDKTDSVDTELFSLRVHLPNFDIDSEITEVNTDQKMMCYPAYIDEDQYNCLFMVTFDDEDIRLNLPLIVHAENQNLTAGTHTYARFIDKAKYDEFDTEFLRQAIPTKENAELSTRQSNIGYIYTKLEKKHSGKYLFVNVISDIQDNLMIVTSIPMFEKVTDKKYEFYPNPNSEQLLGLFSDNLQLKFFVTSSLIVNLVALGGSAHVRWADDASNVYTIKGNGDRLTLTSGQNVDSLIVTRRKEKTDDSPGFVFYLTYYKRDSRVNFDEVKYGQSIEIGYRNTDLPITLYSKIGSYFRDISVAFTFKDSHYDTKGVFLSSPLVLKASLAKESSIYKAKSNPELSPILEKTIVGSYDSAIRTGHVLFSMDDIEMYDIKPEENPTVYLNVAKSKYYSDVEYPNFKIETQIYKVNDEVTPVEFIYNYGKYSGYFNNYYTLKTDKKRPIMVVEISFNSDQLFYAIDYQESRRNDSKIILSSERKNGKSILYLKPENKEYVFLNILRDIRKPNSWWLNNYVFKYANFEKKEDFITFKILNNKNDLEYTEKLVNNETVITCSFNKIDAPKDGANITYFFKVVENSTHFYGEDFKTIAVSESPFYVVYERNPADKNGKITLTAKGDLSNWVSLQVIAKIENDTIVDYVSYKDVYNLRPPKGKTDDGEGSGSGTTIFIIIAVVLGVVIAGLVVIVFIFQQKNKSLLNQVKHVSFQQNNSNSNTDPNLLLHKNNN